MLVITTDKVSTGIPNFVMTRTSPSFFQTSFAHDFHINVSNSKDLQHGIRSPCGPRARRRLQDIVPCIALSTIGKYILFSPRYFHDTASNPELIQRNIRTHRESKNCGPLSYDQWAFAHVCISRFSVTSAAPAFRSILW